MGRQPVILLDPIEFTRFQTALATLWLLKIVFVFICGIVLFFFGCKCVVQEICFYLSTRFDGNYIEVFDPEFQLWASHQYLTRWPLETFSLWWESSWIIISFFFLIGCIWRVFWSKLETCVKQLLLPIWTFSGWIRLRNGLVNRKAASNSIFFLLNKYWLNYSQLSCEYDYTVTNATIYNLKQQHSMDYECHIGWHCNVVNVYLLLILHEIFRGLVVVSALMWAWVGGNPKRKIKKEEEKKRKKKKKKEPSRPP